MLLGLTFDLRSGRGPVAASVALPKLISPCCCRGGLPASGCATALRGKVFMLVRQGIFPMHDHANGKSTRMTLLPRTKVPALTFDTVNHGSWDLAQQKPRHFTMVVVYRGRH